MQCFIWCPVCFSKMELMSYLGKTARVISKRDNNLSNPTKSRYFWDIGANVPGLECRTLQCQRYWMQGLFVMCVDQM